MVKRKRLKKIFNKTIASLIVIVMVFYYVPIVVVATEIVQSLIDTNDEKSSTIPLFPVEDIQDEELPKLVGEMEEKRDIAEKHFLLEDGSMVAAIYPTNIHYEADGKLIDIDNTLVEKIDTNEILKVKDKKVEEVIESQEIEGTRESTEEEKSYHEKVEEGKSNTSEQSILERNKVQESLEKSLEELERNKETRIFENKAGDFKVNFTNKTKGYSLGNITSKGHTMTWGLRDAKSSETKVTNPKINTDIKKAKSIDEIEITQVTSEIEYRNILSYVDLNYRVEPECVKENIILRNKEAISNELVFEYDVQGLKMKLLDTKELLVYDGTEDNVIFRIGTPFMYDSRLEFSGDIELKLEEQDGMYILTLIPDREWLAAKEREYPVTIDPTIYTSLYWENIQDTYIYPGDQTNMTRGNAHILRTGSGWNTYRRSLIKFTLPSLNAGDQIVGANLSICSYPKTSEWTPPTRQIQIAAHKIAADWGEHTATWNNSSGNYNARVEDYAKYQFDNNNQYTFYNFNITSIVKDWYTTGNNYGVMLKEIVETTTFTGNEAYFISSDTNAAYQNGRPMVQIEYRNQTGLEGYLSYHVQDLGRAGTVYTNDYNGNVTLIHHDTSTPGSRLPVSIKHVYNTNDKDTYIGYGAGFRLNLSQTLEQVAIGGNAYVRYIDEDGTRHYFYNNQDEDGLNLTLSLSNNIYTITDKEGNKSEFTKNGDIWHLTKIKDMNNNEIVITRNPSDYNLITKVRDGAGYELLFNYSQWNSLISIQNVDGTYIYFNYANADLIKITYPDNKVTWYTSNTNGLLYHIANIDSRVLAFDFYAAKPYRVKSIKEYSTVNELGNTLDIVYGNNSTKFTDNEGYSNNVIFNNWGQAISVADFGKGTVDLNKAYGKNYTYGNSGGSKNKLTLDGKLTQPVTNLVYNGSAEYTGEWTLVEWDINSGTGQYATDDRYDGNKSLKITSSHTQKINTIYRQTTTATKGKTYTLSAQAKNSNIGNGQLGGYIELFYINASGIAVGAITRIDKNLTGWNKHSLTIDYPSNATSPLYVVVGLTENTGTMYFDQIQLEEGTIANPYNYIQNGGFNDGSKSWVLGNTDTNDTVANGQTKLTGDANKDKFIYQGIQISGQAGDIYNLSGWVNVEAIPNYNGKVAGITVCILGMNNEEKWETVYATPGASGWQYLSTPIVAPYNYKQIIVDGLYYRQANTAYFDNLSLIKDESGNSYTYDTNGNLVNAKDLAKQNSTFQYDANNNLISAANPRGGSFTYTYDTAYKHRLTKATSSLGIDYNFGYNSFGQNTNIKTIGSGTEYIENKATYSADGRYLETLEDERGNITTYTTNALTGTVSKITDAKQIETNYTYDILDRLIDVNKTNGTTTYQNNYIYSNDRLNTINHNNTNYSFVYDTFGNTKQVKVGNQTLITNNYATRNGNLTSSVYGNDQTISYIYDRFNRVTKKAGTDGSHEYIYDARGNLYGVKNNVVGETETYTYDLADRLLKSTNTNGFSTNYTYDQNSMVNTAKYTLGTQTNTTTYTFSKENRISDVSIGTNRSIQMNYDSLSRPISKVLTSGTNTYTTSYTYQNTNIANKTTTMINSVKNDNEQLDYTYDTLGNIETITKGTDQRQKYYYDSLSQIIREDNKDINKTITYIYDVGGNITVKEEYNYTTQADLTNLAPTNTINYTYGNINWKDQLTLYNGNTITYDQIR